MTRTEEDHLSNRPDGLHQRLKAAHLLLRFEARFFRMLLLLAMILDSAPPLKIRHKDKKTQAKVVRRKASHLRSRL